MVNGDLRLWVSQLMRDAQQAKPAEVPPPPGTVFDMLPLPAFDRILSFCGGGGDVLRLIEEVDGQRGGGYFEKYCPNTDWINTPARTCRRASCF